MNIKKKALEITILVTLTCILFGLWHWNLFAGFFLGLLILTILAFVNAVVEAYLDDKEN